MKVFYHFPCADGFCAAWVVWTQLSLQDRVGVEFIPINYGSPFDPESCAGDDVIIVDFSFPLPVMQRLIQLAKSVVCLDHHKTAKEALGHLQNDSPECVIRFDMGKSGARLAWEHFHGTTGPVPWQVEYTEDADLWRWVLPDSRAVKFGIRLFPFDFEEWEKLDFTVVMMNGKIVEIYVDEQIRQCKEHAILGNRGYPIVNCSHGDIISDVAGQLAEESMQGIGCCYYIDEKNQMIRVSLRSRSDIDVSEVAKAYGGGGHKNAAGFSHPLGDFSWFKHMWLT